MSFSGIVHVRQNGRLALPKELVGPVVVSIPSIGLKLVMMANGSLIADRAAITIPSKVRSLVKAPCDLMVSVQRSIEDEFRIEPLGVSIEFFGEVLGRGSGRSLNIPASIVAGMLHVGWSAVKVQVGAESTVIRLRPNSNGVVDVSLPKTCRIGRSKIKIENIQESMNVIADGGAFDWMSVPFERDRIVVGERLIVPTIRSQFELIRFSPWKSTMWMLGFYLAEGSKNGLDFCVTSKSRVSLRKLISCLSVIGVANDAIRLNVIYGRSSKKKTKAYYQALEISIATIRADTSQKGRDHAAELHLRGSRGFVELVLSALNRDLWLAPLSARTAFLLGYLDGDATVSDDHGLSLKVSCANQVEADLVSQLVDEYLERSPGAKAVQKVGAFEFRRSLSMINSLRLIEDDAFRHSLARARLFYAVHRVLYPGQVTAQHCAHGYFLVSGEPSKFIEEARIRFITHQVEWDFIRRSFPTERSTRAGKGVLYEFRPTGL